MECSSNYNATWYGDGDYRHNDGRGNRGLSSTHAPSLTLRSVYNCVYSIHTTESPRAAVYRGCAGSGAGDGPVHTK